MQACGNTVKTVGMYKERAFPHRGKVARKGRMRADPAAATHLRAITVHQPLIRPRSEPRPPSPTGEGFQTNDCGAKQKHRAVLNHTVFEKLLDKLFRDDALDIATDIDVLKTMVAGDGLSESGQLHL